MRILRETTSRDGVLSLEDAWAEPPTFAFLPEKSVVEEAWVERALDALPDELRVGCFALLTSGSTGHPKLVVGSRARAEELTRVLHAAQESEPVEAGIATLPLSYCYSFVNQWLWARVHGRAFVPTRGFSEPDRLGEVLANARSAMMCLVGAQLPLFDAHLPGGVHPGVIRVHFAGGPFPEERLDDVRRRFPAARIYNNYGCAEAMPRLTLRRAEEASSAALIGRPLPGVELRSGADGALEFRSPYAAVAFWEDERLRVLAEGDWIPSGDLGEPAGDGQWRLLGRAGSVFKRYGEKVSIAALSETVAGAWHGQPCFYRERDGMGEEGVVLLLVPDPTAEEARAVLRALRARHPRTHWPLRLESAPSLPVLPNGKPDLSALATLPGKSVHWKNRT